MGGGMSVSSHDRQPATRARSAMAPTSPRSGISMPMWANGALIGWRLPLSRQNMTSTRTNGFSTCLAWLSHALWPSSSSRRSRMTRGVNSSYHAIDASRSLDGSAMWVQRGWVSIGSPCLRRRPPLRFGRLLLAPLGNRFSDCPAAHGGAGRRRLSLVPPCVRYFDPGARQQGALHLTSCASQLVLVDGDAPTIAHDDAAV